MVTLLMIMTLGVSYPDVTLAQGFVESKMNIFAVGKAREQGAYQIREKYWGKVPRTFTGQTQQADRILMELLGSNHGDIWKAVERYNGRGKASRVYRAKVQRRTIEARLLTTQFV
jgi:hypothetical protein